MPRIIQLLLLILTLFIGQALLTHAQTDPGNPVLENDEYLIEIQASQWQFLAIDLNRVKLLLEEGMDVEEARNQSMYDSSVGIFIPGKMITFAVRSRDVQHGFQFSYESSGDQSRGDTTVSIQVATNRPIPGEQFGEFTNETIQLPSEPMTILSQCYIFCGLGHPDMKIEFVIGTPSTLAGLAIISPQLLFITIAFVTILSVVYVRIKSGLVVQSLHLPAKQENIISEIFRSRTSLYYYVLGQRSPKDSLKDENELQTAVPQDLFKFKFLLHPMRLTMMKLLYENLQMTSLELKDLLGASWNDIGTHLTALKNKNYIKSSHQFLEGSRKQLVTIEPLGTEQYKILLDVLHLFLDNISDYGLFD